MPTSDRPLPDELRAEYGSEDLKDHVRGKYADKAKLFRMVAIDADLAQAFPTAAAVNEALRALLKAREAADETK